MMDIFPFLAGLAPFGLILGSSAAQQGLSLLELHFMNVTVFAGGAQFLALSMWKDPLPVMAILTGTLLINLRFLMLGAALTPVLDKLPFRHRMACLYYLTDAQWAVTLKRAARVDKVTPAYLIGLNGLMFSVWVAASTVGFVLGGLIRDPHAWGFDFVFIAMFSSLAAGFIKGRSGVVVASVTATVAITVHGLVGGNAHIFIGAAAGALSGALFPRKEGP